jgi:hypothetical protein
MKPQDLKVGIQIDTPQGLQDKQLLSLNADN